MYVSIKDLAEREGCSVSQVYRNVREMESSSLYPQGVKESGGLKSLPECKRDGIKQLISAGSQGVRRIENQC